MAAAMVSLGIATGFERRYGVLKRLGSTPLVARRPARRRRPRRCSRFELLQVAARSCAIGVALGWHVPGGIVPALGLLLIGTVAFAGIGMLMAGTLRAEANLAAANGLFLVLLFLGGMAYPLAKLPGAMQAFAKLLPAAALSETVRSVLVDAAVPDRRARRALAWAVARAARRRPLLPLGGVNRLQPGVRSGGCRGRRAGRRSRVGARRGW